MNKLINVTIGLIFNQLHMEKTWNLAETYGNLRKWGKGFCIAETVQKLTTSGFSWLKLCDKLFSLFQHCWNWTKTYSSGFCWQKLDGIQLKLYNSFSIAETILETSTPSFFIVSAVFQFCWNGIFHPVIDSGSKQQITKHKVILYMYS